MSQECLKIKLYNQKNIREKGNLVIIQTVHYNKHFSNFLPKCGTGTLKSSHKLSFKTIMCLENQKLFFFSILFGLYHSSLFFLFLSKHSTTFNGLRKKCFYLFQSFLKVIVVKVKIHNFEVFRKDNTMHYVRALSIHIFLIKEQLSLQ